MNHSVRVQKNKVLNVPILIAAAVAVTFFLLFIDEGYYDFRWMKSPGNWIVGAIYALIIFVVELIFARVLFKNVTRVPVSILVLFFGVLAGVVTAISIFMAISS